MARGLFSWVLLALAGTAWGDEISSNALGGGAWLLFKRSLVILPGVLIGGLALWVLILRIVAKKVQRVIAF